MDRQLKDDRDRLQQKLAEAHEIAQGILAAHECPRRHSELLRWMMALELLRWMLERTFEAME